MKKTNKESKNTNVKIIISFVVAFVLWIYVIGDQDPKNEQRYTNINVQVRNEQTLVDKELVLSDTLDITVDIIASGKTSVLFNLPWRSITAYVDLSAVTEKGTFDLPITIQNMPENVELVSVTPATITVEIDQLTQQNREIKVELIGELPEGLQLTDYTVNPRTVVIEGGENILATVKKVGGTLDLTDRHEGFSEIVQLKAYDDRGLEILGVTLDPAEVTATATIGNNYLLPVEAIISGEPGDGYVIKEIQIAPKQIAILSQGPTPVEQIKTESINIQGIKENAEITARLIFPKGLESATNVESVQVKIVVEPIETREFSISILEYRNRSKELEVASDQREQSVLVRLSGGASTIQALQQNQIQLYVDLANAQVGENQAKLQMDVLDGITLEQLEPSVWNVVLEEVKKE